MASRLISDLTPSMQRKYRLFEAKMRAIGLDYIVTCTKRSVEEQVALYAQGRTTPGKVVTWTLFSRHIPREEDRGTPDFGKSHAFDIVLTHDSRPVWDVKCDVNADDIPDYKQAGQIGESVGLRWGGRFKDSHGRPLPDYCHFEG